jgi:antitoxin PrlF
MITSKITSKAQTTIPQPVRIALGLQEGDQIAYQIDGDRVVLTRAPTPRTPDDPFATFTEWSTAADREGYADF